MKAGIYARVSTQDQTYEQQINNCIRYCKVKEWEYDIFAEKISGAAEKRTELDRMLQRMRQGEFQAIVVWKLDRLGRSTMHLLQLLEEFRNQKVQLAVTTMGLNTENPEGKFFFTVIAAFAEMERGFVKQRVQAALDTKRAQGIPLGRPKGAKDNRPRRRSGYIQRWADTPRKGQSHYQLEQQKEKARSKQ